MDIKNYISSGVLELYVLDMLPLADRQEVERNMLKYPIIRKEVEIIERAMETYAERSRMTPSTDLEQSIMKKVNQTDRALPTDSSGTSGFNWFALILGLGLLGALGLGLYFYNGYTESQSELSELQSDHDLLVEDCGQKDSVINNLTSQIDLLLDLNNVAIKLGEPNNPTRELASVLYNRVDKKSYLNLGALPEAPSGKTYQLWALVDGQPVDMGVYEINAAGDSTLIEVPFIENAGAFAITLENGRQVAPDLTQLQVIGNVS